jgi:toxin ParE1/3/4
VRSQKSKSFELLITDRALRDIKCIEEYSTKEWGKRVAEKYIFSIEAALDLITTNPGLLRSANKFSKFLKFYNVEKHLLVFDILNRKTLILLTILHGSMDIPERLLELEPLLSSEIELLHKRLSK